MSPRGFAVVLPARYDSTRFPGKPLALVSGRPLIEWVFHAAARIKGARQVIVATDSPRILDAVKKFGGKVVLTSSEHRTGTDRVAEVAEQLDCEYIVNLQGDELIFPEGLVEKMVSQLINCPDTDIVTACHPIRRKKDLDNPNHVKVVIDASGKALYFSRSAIPHGAEKDGGSKKLFIAYRHIGIYAFRRSSLIEFASLPPTPLEISEGLEQLRALENGMEIRVVLSPKPTVGVDLPADIKIVEKALAGQYTGTLEKIDASCLDDSKGV
ncbi:MAG: 3-deoxy-manno-octulosonate cytidylyltransferase [Candidatus Latescibacteria bacterium]|nr:3-deoxy-manno-octulosonate cytidylyltransferase [Candidatus Latescibacterota bacterium]NIM22084.1 3-deoxy-manno-octulosonate cytidylyltransferase [Candidatus Latescibacterota bacterium]NIM66103.1 3-deoxy-manno-octulosonate cytidylyltransferase [Candidatus Latescibacterota bacterium]NIO02511.1 3-deoxy-manno-octulosonate cytidylyltransferase [Candidatus Latescibacterota bacterium]NIO29422.1 3-deoxy-manno-octulosonate cytidylyltransferase [Candidatus Latescibacterota bacterium]